MDVVGQAVILAGGYGTRLKPFTDSEPKPMYRFRGKPFLEYLIDQARSFGIRDVVLLLGYLPERIMDYFGDGSELGVRIRYSVTPAEYGTGRRMKAAFEEGLLAPQFLLMYCDNYCPIDFRRLCREHRSNGALIQLTAYANTDGYTKDNLRVAEGGRVEAYDRTRTAGGLHGVDIGYAIVDREAVALVSSGNGSFEAEVYSRLAGDGQLFATVTHHRYYSIGSWERIGLTEKFFSRRKYVFLDRDGTLNVRPPRARYVERPEEFVWLPGARRAVKRLKDAGYGIVLVTNQPGIARGRLDIGMLDAIHGKMQRDLEETGARIDHVYYCPHGWDEGCGCRKPEPGMLYQAQRDLSLDLTECWMLGDDERDMRAGGDAGCRCMLVTERHPLEEAVDIILALEGKS